ncbi:hypothetical protein [Streptomyces sp. ITFR-16]|uniref:hypothetical protein n=1 Tax=Streptomyces sp. ITFR-16 TaxID=3075198 RepID=UPI0028895E2C|nr:hypothetical protein [Streptomyces sp. ITFR-16]WNI23854.1 hypothetical protein RLT58_18895 [Streptomyces sp. ITFR-16]
MDPRHERDADQVIAFMEAFTMDSGLLVDRPQVEPARERVRAPSADEPCGRPVGLDT